MSTLILAAALADSARGTGAGVRSPARTGRALYAQYCAACHGTDLRGGAAAPTLIGAGAERADFWISTGRMPAAVPWLEVSHRGEQPYLSATQEALIVAYVASVSPGPPIPIVLTNGDPARGRELFRQNCMHCHGVDASGAGIGGANWAPSLANATVTQVAEAIRTGPGQMPQFGERQIDQAELDDIATYLSQQRGSQRFTGLPIGSGGPVPEGLYGWIAAGILALFAFGYWSFDRKEPTRAR
jgi:ubiquinol-cytochrome c reductase cytochrome c subunit